MPRKDDLELRELFSQPYVPRCVPLEHIPLHIEVDGIRVEGEIVKLWPSDMIVQLGDQGSSLHVPHFAMGPVCRLATDDGTSTLVITRRGQQRAESLLRELYELRQADRP